MEEPDVPPGTEMLNFETPTLDDEESESSKVPSVMKCGACIAVSYQIEKDIKHFESLRPLSKMNMPLDELARIEVFEKACRQKTNDG